MEGKTNRKRQRHVRKGRSRRWRSDPLPGSALCARSQWDEPARTAFSGVVDERYNGRFYGEEILHEFCRSSDAMAHC